MTAIPSRQRKRLVGALISGLAAAFVLPIGVIAGGNALLGSSGGRSVDASQQLKIPSTPMALLATVNDANALTTLTLFVLAPEGVGGTIISLPANTRVEIVGAEAPRTLADSYTQGGLAALTIDAEGVLDVTFTSVGALGIAETAVLLSTVPTIRVDFDKPVVNTQIVAPDPNATTTTVKKRPKVSTTTAPPAPLTADAELFAAGEMDLAPDQAAAVLVAKRAGEPEIDRLARTKSLWVGVAAAVGGGVAIDPAVVTETTIAGSAPSDIAAFVRYVFAGPIQVWQLTAVPLAAADNPTASDIYMLDRAEVLLLMASVAPSSLSGGDSGFSVQVDSPFNDISISHAIVERLLYLGIGVALVREVAGPPNQQTSFNYLDKASIEGSQASLESVLGALKYSNMSRSVEGISAQIILGQDFADFIAATPTLPSTTIAATDG
jgi:hypothetical protein